MEDVLSDSAQVLAWASNMISPPQSSDVSEENPPNDSEGETSDSYKEGTLPSLEELSPPSPRRSMSLDVETSSTGERHMLFNM
jgi:hypothetical protein